MMSNQTRLCSDDNDDGCGQYFVAKTTTGLCFKCAKLSSFTPGSHEYNAVSIQKQCTSCGRSWKNFQGGICGSSTCSNRVMPPPPGGAPAQPQTHDMPPPHDPAQVALEASRAARKHAMDARLSKQSAPAFAPGGPLSGNLSAHDSGSVYISFDARVRLDAHKAPTKLDFDIGNWGRAFKKSVYMSEVLEDAVNTVNGHWNKREGCSLLPSEAELRWKGNGRFLNGSDGLQLEEFLELYLNGENAAHYGQLVNRESSGSKKSGGAMGRLPPLKLPFELYIDRVAFDERRHASANSAASFIGGSRKRSGTQSNMRGAESSKRRAGEHPAALSSFIPSVISRREPNTSLTIEITRARAGAAEATGLVDISWPKDGVAESATLFQEVLAAGKTKKVHKLILGQDLYVAKRFFDIGTSKAPTAAENQDLLEYELIRLLNLEWFLKGFFALAKEKQVEYEANIAVTEAFLVREIGEPSEPSNLAIDDWGNAVWLVEPRRSTAVIKFNGTLRYPAPKDKTGITISALLHFIYLETSASVAFADIQGSKITKKGVETLVLFDPMTHTPDGDSGIGDHGNAGVDRFVAEHRCTYICHELGYDPLSDAGAYIPPGAGNESDGDD